MEETRIDHIAGGIYRISTWTPQYPPHLQPVSDRRRAAGVDPHGRLRVVRADSPCDRQSAGPGSPGLHRLAPLGGRREWRNGSFHARGAGRRAARIVPVDPTQRAPVWHHRAGPRIQGRRDTFTRQARPQISRDAPRPSLGLDDGGGRDNQEPVPIRLCSCSPAISRRSSPRTCRTRCARSIVGPVSSRTRGRCGRSSTASPESISSGFTPCTAGR